MQPQTTIEPTPTPINTIIPSNNFILIRKDPAITKKGEITLSRPIQSPTATILMIGPDVSPEAHRPGDRIIYFDYAVTEVEDDLGTLHHFIRPTDIIAHLE